MQYYHVAKVLLYSHDPGSIDHTGDIHNAALKICGLANTNRNVSARVNAFGPLAFCESSLEGRPLISSLV